MDSLSIWGFVVGCFLMLLYMVVKRTIKDAALSISLLIASMSVTAGIKIILFALNNSELAEIAKAQGIEVWTIALAGVALILFTGIALFTSFFKPTP